MNSRSANCLNRSTAGRIAAIDGARLGKWTESKLCVILPEPMEVGFHFLDVDFRRALKPILVLQSKWFEE